MTVLIAMVVILVVLALVLGGWGAATYNALVRLGLRVDNAFAQIDVILKQRHDLVPSLVECVKGYAAHEADIFNNLSQARASAMGASSVQQKVEAENMLSQAMGRLLAVSEAYPQLKADANFQQLMSQLSEIENKIAVSRQIYNDTVQTYNTKGKTFPTVVIAGMVGFREREFLRASEEEQAAPTVKFT